MQNSREVRKSNRGQFGWLYKVLCQEKCVKPLPAVQAYLRQNCLRFCADRVDLKDWSPILNTIVENRSLSKISIYSRSRRRKIREKINTEEKLAKLWRCRGKDRKWPILYTNFLLRCLVDSIAVLMRDSSMITSITFDGIPLTPKYLNILCSGLENNRSLRNLSLINCRIGDTGCDLVLGCLRNNSSLRLLNLSSCSLTNRSAMCLSLFLKTRKADLLQNVWEESALQSENGSPKKQHQGLHTLVLNKNHKFGDNGVRQLIYALKSDFWLKSLSVRHCGITKHGAEGVVDLLQTNTILTKVDLSENHVPNNILRTVSMILKRRQEKEERMSLGKRVPNWKRKARKKREKKPLSKSDKRLIRRSERRIKSCIKCYQSKKPRIRGRRSFDKKRKIIETENSASMINLHELELQLADIINNNAKLKDLVTCNKTMLETEVQGRLKAEIECEKITPQLNDLKSKVVLLSRLRSKVSGESQLLNTLRHVFENLESLSSAKQIANDDNEDGVPADNTESLQPEAKLLQRMKMASPLQRRPYCPPLKI